MLTPTQRLARARAREADWELLRHSHWAFQGRCTSCGQRAHVRGKRKSAVKCRDCYLR